MKKIALILPLVLLAACSNVKQQLGVGRNSPDEFTVVKRAPLSLPPGYELRAPADADAPPASAAAAQAKTFVLGEGQPQTQKAGADEALLAKMGAANADPTVRAAINRENGYIALENRTVADKLIFWKEGNTTEDKSAPVVDASAEKERLEKNKAEGKPANEGETPTIEKKKSAIDKIF